jgi:hypothetical protein
MAIESGGHQPPSPHNRLASAVKGGRSRSTLISSASPFTLSVTSRKDSPLSERVTGVKRREPRAGHLRRLELLSSANIQCHVGSSIFNELATAY